MRTLFFISIIILFTSCDNAAKKEIVAPLTLLESTEPVFDSIKAAQYGADEYGMKKYVIAFLKKGPKRDLDSASAYGLQMAHMENIKKMAKAGQLVLAGPFLNDGDIRGIYIFNVESIEKAQALTETDPAIKAGSLMMELLPWYGSAALIGVNAEHKKVAKTLF